MPILPCGWLLLRCSCDIRAPRKRRKAENFLTETQSLSPGDLVVHVDHGIGRFTGMEVITAAGAAHGVERTLRHVCNGSEHPLSTAT